jgi:tetratricopeptide (TPR) repeat protein
VNQKALAESRLALAVGPNSPIAYVNLTTFLCVQGQYDEAEAVIRKAREMKLDESAYVHYQHYQLALLRSDQGALERELMWMTENADEPQVLEAQAQIAVYEGKIVLARQRTGRTAKMLLESNHKGTASQALLNQATAETLDGISTQAGETIRAAEKLAEAKDEEEEVAMVLALTGQRLQAQQIIDRLLREYPSDTLLNGLYAPLVLATSQLKSGQAAAAARTLEQVRPYEFGWAAQLLPNYLRARAYLQMERAEEAAAEFRLVLEHRGVSPLATEWVLSHLGLGRAYAMQGDTAKAKATYQAFSPSGKTPSPTLPS